jgi:hypothetical protein
LCGDKKTLCVSILVILVENAICMKMQL